MKPFLFNLVKFLMPLLIVAGLIDICVTNKLKTTNHKTFLEWNLIAKGVIDADIIVMGSSRAWNHVSPPILDSILEKKVYNLGNDDYDFFMQLNKYYFYRQLNSLPDTILLTLDLNTFNRRVGLYKQEQYLPYFFNANVRKLTNSYEGFVLADYLLPFYRYINYLTKIKEAAFMPFDSPSSSKRIMGYEPKEMQWDGSFNSFNHNDSINFSISPELVTYFEEFVNKCEHEGTKVIMIFPPIYFKVWEMNSHYTSTRQLYDSLSRKLEIEYLDYTKDKIDQDTAFFQNAMHLNKQGAELFSVRLALQLKNKPNEQNF